QGLLPQPSDSRACQDSLEQALVILSKQPSSLEVLASHLFFNTGYCPTSLPQSAIFSIPPLRNDSKRNAIDEVNENDGEGENNTRLNHCRESEQERRWKGKQAKASKVNFQELKEELDQLKEEKLAVLREYKTIRRGSAR
ncbi:hypothetical protein BGZ95_005678, partial [Linnemannia exigua]